MKPINKFKTLFYTGVCIVLGPVLITIVMVLFSGSSDSVNKKEVSIINTDSTILTNSNSKSIIETTKTIITKPKKKKIQTVETVKVIKLDTTILKTDTL
jgi:hypothetical protein